MDHGRKGWISAFKKPVGRRRMAWKMGRWRSQELCKIYIKGKYNNLLFLNFCSVLFLNSFKKAYWRRNRWKYQKKAWRTWQAAKSRQRRILDGLGNFCRRIWKFDSLPFAEKYKWRLFERKRNSSQRNFFLWWRIGTEKCEWPLFKFSRFEKNSAGS